MHSHGHACCLFNPTLIYVYEVNALFIICVACLIMCLLPCLGLLSY